MANKSLKERVLDELVAERDERRKKEAEAATLRHERLAYWGKVLDLWRELGTILPVEPPDVRDDPNEVVALRAIRGAPMDIPQPNALNSSWAVREIELFLEPYASDSPGEAERRKVVFVVASGDVCPQRMASAGTAAFWEEYFLSAFTGVAKKHIGGLSELDALLDEREAERKAEALV